MFIFLINISRAFSTYKLGRKTKGLYVFENFNYEIKNFLCQYLLQYFPRMVKRNSNLTKYVPYILY